MKGKIKEKKMRGEIERQKMRKMKEKRCLLREKPSIKPSELFNVANFVIFVRPTVSNEVVDEPGLFERVIWVRDVVDWITCFVPRTVDEDFEEDLKLSVKD